MLDRLSPLALNTQSQAAPATAQQLTQQQAQQQAQQQSRMREVAEDFESIFIHQILSTMSQGLTSDGMFGGGHAEETFRGLMNEEYAKVMSVNGGFGIADAVYRQLMQIQEAQQ